MRLDTDGIMSSGERGETLPLSRAGDTGAFSVSKPPPLLEAVASELSKCNRCGFCQARCPVYRTTGLEASVARGHIARVRAVLEGELPWDDVLRRDVFACLMCRACTAECPPGISTDKIIAAARATLARQRQSAVQRLIFRHLLPHPTRLRLAARVLSLLKRARVTKAARLLKLVPWVDRGLAEAEAMVPAPSRDLRHLLARRRPAPALSRQVVYFVGCGIDYAEPEIGEATVEVLEAAGYRVTVARNVCCGLPAYAYGDLQAARELARRNLSLLSGLSGEAVVTDCASCSSFLRQYPELLAGDAEAARRVAELASRVREFSEFLSSLSLPPLKELHRRATYHDPCHLSRYERVTEQPRALLRQVPGLEFRPLPEADWCCGGAGSYALAHYHVSMAILQRKMENVRATGADLLVTTCPACVMQLRHGVGRFGPDVEVLHLSQVLRRALG